MAIGMRHPSEYTTTRLDSMDVMVVDAGTIIKDQRTGREETVTANSAVAKGRVIYCTQPTFDALKARTVSQG